MKTWRHWCWLALSLTLSACLLPKLNKAERSEDTGPAKTGGAVGGSGGEGGAGGSGASERGPIPLRQFATDQVDLLLMVDNSISMGDKQRLLGDAVSGLIERMAQPPCVDENGTPTGAMADASGRCAQGLPQFPPPKDIHVAVVTSSLGSHGASGAKDVCVDPSGDDHAHLLGKVRGLKDTWNDAGFLVWDPSKAAAPPGISDPTRLKEAVNEMVAAVGEHGCGFESSLESWYRFLVDPEPPQSVQVKDGIAEPVGIDKELLAERKAFLRDGSALAIIMFTDENDCSIIDSGLGWLVARAMPLSRSSTECAHDPNDECCRSCQDAEPHKGCRALADDPECSKSATLGADDDELALRCWQQKRRFGMDLLYPTQRYVDALTSPTIARRSDGKLIRNPLLAARNPSAISLLGIVGVPWQDLATQDSLLGADMTYLTPHELAAKGRWKVILGEPDAAKPVPPLDPFMIETPEDRTNLVGVPQVNPVSRDELVSSSSQDPFANRINGHEQVNTSNQDLQYACTFRLPKPRECDDAVGAADMGCECYAAEASYNRPLCQPSQGGPATTTQYGAKAYPGLRQLQVLRDLGDLGLTASICPTSLEAGDKDYGYGPAMQLLAERITHGFVTCFDQALTIDQAGKVACRAVAARPDSPVCECPNGTSQIATGDLHDAAVRGLRDQGVCGDDLAATCGDLCLCEIPQLSGDALEQCQSAGIPPAEPGFCYINAVEGEQNVGSGDLLHECPAENRRLIRFVGDGYLRDSEAFLLCE